MSLFAGQTLTAGLLNSVAPMVAYKTGNETVNNTITPQDDDHLFVTVPANSVFVVDAFIAYTSNSTADFFFGFIGPASSTFAWSAWGQGTGATTVEGVIKNETRDITIGSAHGGTGAPLTVRPTGLLTVTFAGTFRLRWSQNVADPSNTTVHAGSWLRLQRIV